VTVLPSGFMARFQLVFWCACTILGQGCTFSVGAVGGDVGPLAADLSGSLEDLAGADLTGQPVPDLGGQPPGDLALPQVASHTAVPFDPTASDLSSVTEIDTGARKLRINGGAPQDPPAGVTFVADPANNATVMTVGAWNVDKDVDVIGGPALIVLASKDVTISKEIRAFGKQNVPGPGGFGPAMGPGAGNTGEAGNGADDSGGAGGSFGTLGGEGGPASGVSAPLPRPTYGALLGDFKGGSGGGHGGEASSCDGTGTRGRGGAGGGVVQISSRGAIVMKAGGGINAGGGGGEGGCDDVTFSSAGGGGGSGGLIFLEAVTLQVDGKLSANGGGGGGGASSLGFPGHTGDDAKAGTAVAAGGGGTSIGGAGGGDGAAGVLGPTNGGVNTNSGGGGGGQGRIFLRTRGTDPKTGGGAVFSPAQVVDKGF